MLYLIFLHYITFLHILHSLPTPHLQRCHDHCQMLPFLHLLQLLTAVQFFQDEKGQYYIKYTSYINVGCPIFFVNSLSYNLTYLTLITHHPISKHVRSSPSNVAILTLITAINPYPIFFEDEKRQYYIKYTSYIHAGCPNFFVNSLSYNLTYLTLITHHPISKHVQSSPSNVAFLTLITAINCCPIFFRIKKGNIT